MNGDWWAMFMSMERGEVCMWGEVEEAVRAVGEAERKREEEEGGGRWCTEL